MRSLACVTRAFLCGFLALSLASTSAGSHRLSSAAIHPWPVAVIPSAVDLESLSSANLVAWPVTCSAAAYTRRRTCCGRFLVKMLNPSPWLVGKLPFTLL